MTGAVRLFTPKEAGVQLGGASENHIYRLVALGELRSVDISLPGSRRSKTRIREDDLAAYVEKRTNGPPECRRPGTRPGPTNTQTTTRRRKS